jgi:hypothetical protein
MLVLQRAVMLETLPPVIPGGLRANIDWRILSSSATQDDMMDELDVDTAYFSSLGVGNQGLEERKRLRSQYN